MRNLQAIKLIFSLIGLAMVGVAIFSAFNTHNFIQSATLAQATVIDMVARHSDDGTTYAPVYQFRTSQGELIESVSSSSSNPPSYHVNQRVVVYYDANNPQESKLDGFFSLWGVSVILGGMGSVFMLFGVVPVIFGKIRAKKQALLKRQGMQVVANIQRVTMNTNISVNHRHPFVIEAVWRDPTTGNEREFSSNNLWFDPSPQLAQPTIQVYIDRNNPKKYFMDTSFLAQSA